MHLASNSKKFSGALVAFALITSSTGAVAASTHTAQPASISPFVALSALASDASRVALVRRCRRCRRRCRGRRPGRSAGLRVAGRRPGAAPPVAEALPPPPVAPPPVAPLASEGFGISPLLLGLVAVAAAVGLYFLLHKKKSSSPN